MVNNENETSEADALLRSESLRATIETDAVNNNSNNSEGNDNGTFTVRVNVGSLTNEGGISELRRRRTAQEVETRNDTVPVYARTIHRMPGQVNVVPSQPLSHGGPVRRIHIQTNPNGTTTVRTNNNGSATQGHEQVQFVTMNNTPMGHQQPRGNSSDGAAPRITIPLRTSSRGRAIRVAPGSRHQQVQIVGNTIQARQSQHVAHVQVPPLVPQPLPYHGLHRSAADSSTEHSHDERNEFKCLICFEFLQDPASCGKCSSRFCLACIRRVAQTRTNNAPAKCPACRGALDDIVRDHELANRMQRAESVTCQYEGCNVKLSLTQVAAHEQSCVFVPIKCRYASFGCDWKGTRQTLSQHEATCPLMQVSKFVQQFRQLRADHEYTLNQLQSRVAATNAMMELHASLIRRLQKRNYHPGDLLDFVYTITCTPARFIYTKDVWRSLTACQLSRGFLLNVFTFLPTTLLVLRIAATGFRQLLSVSSLVTTKDIDNLVDASYSFLICFMFFFMVTIFVVIGKNSIDWQPTNRMERFLQEGCAFLSCVVQSEAMFYNDRFVTWPMICICSTVFPSLILYMMETASGLTRGRPVANFLSAGRAIPVVLFGIRYGLVASSTGAIACLDAVAFQSFLQQNKSERMKPLFVSQDCFLTDLPRNVGVGYVSTRGVIITLLWKHAEMPVNVLDSLAACILLLVVNYLTNHLIILGNIIAKYVHAQALENVLPNQGGVRKECNVVGCLSFATWLLLLSGIVLSY